MDKYFGSSSVECVLSDIFWAAIKGDIVRVKHLVEIEGESPTDSNLDPWNVSCIIAVCLLLLRSHPFDIKLHLLVAAASPNSAALVSFC